MFRLQMRSYAAEHNSLMCIILSRQVTRPHAVARFVSRKPHYTVDATCKTSWLKRLDVRMKASNFPPEPLGSVGASPTNGKSLP